MNYGLKMEIVNAKFNSTGAIAQLVYDSSSRRLVEENA